MTNRSKKTLIQLTYVMLTGVGCSWFDNLEPRPRDSAPCVHATIPPLPVINAPPDGSIDFVVAVKEYDLGDVDKGSSTERFRSMGFDLDSTCTGAGEDRSCIKPAWATGDDTDGPQGRDNAFGANLYRAALDGGASSTLLANSGIDSGLVTQVIRVRGYNGVSLDSKVEVAIYAATTHVSNATPRPAWNGQDTWAALEQYVNPDAGGVPSIDHPKYYDANAYVTNWILVAQFDYLFIPLELLSQVKVTARIVWKDERWFLFDGTVAARIKTDELLWTTGDPLCTDSPSYLPLMRAICAASDISYSGPDDGTAPCDGTSWAWEFTAWPAWLAGVQQRPVSGTCPAVKDTCSTLE